MNKYRWETNVSKTGTHTFCEKRQKKKKKAFENTFLAIMNIKQEDVFIQKG